MKRLQSYRCFLFFFLGFAPFRDTERPFFFLLKKVLPLSEVGVTFGENGHLIICDFSLFAKEYRFKLFRAPKKCSKRVCLFFYLSLFLETERSAILLGGFNCVCCVIDRASGNDYVDISAQILQV